MEISILLSGILGPILVALSVTEYLNFKIWENVHPTVVYLNGLILLTGGLIILRLHHIWIMDWTILITVIGWLLCIAGLFRMFFPNQKQLSQTIGTNILLLVLLLIGIVLSYKAFFA